MPVLFFGHFAVQGASLNLGTGASGKKLDFKNTSSHDISVSDLDKSGADYVFLGDFHSHQVLPTKNCVSMYTGSIEKDDITHRDLAKGFVVYDTEYPQDDVYGQCKFIEYPNCRPMVSITGGLKKIRKEVSELDKKDKGASVRIVFEGTAQEAQDYHLALEDIRESVKAKLQPVHLFDAQKISSVEEDKKAQELEQKIVEKGYMTEDEVMEVLGEILLEQVDDEEEHKLLVCMAKEIRKEAKGL
jgi:DNA repair exonuclease SbcCD nuclease subunit